MQDINTVVVKRSDGVNETQVVQTRADEPNIRVTPMTVTRVIFTRTARVYMQTFMGLLGAGMTGVDGGILPNDFASLALKCAQLSVAAAGVTLGQNILEILGRLDEKAPQWRA